MLRERVISLGRRDARGRIAHLVCELFWRHKAVKLADDQAFRLPLTQEELGDALGLTQVHVNRVMRIFYEQRIMGMENRRMCLLDLNRLQRISGVKKSYLLYDKLSKSFDIQHKRTQPLYDEIIM